MISTPHGVSYKAKRWATGYVANRRGDDGVCVAVRYWPDGAFDQCWAFHYSCKDNIKMVLLKSRRKRLGLHSVQWTMGCTQKSWLESTICGMLPEMLHRCWGKLIIKTKQTSNKSIVFCQHTPAWVIQVVNVTLITEHLLWFNKMGFTRIIQKLIKIALDPYYFA